MSLNYQLIGQRIKTARNRKNFSQALLSELIDKTPGYISYIETGDKCLSLETLVAIANELDVTADMLLAENLKINFLVATNDVADLLSDCTDGERRVLIESLKALKTIIRENKHGLIKR